MLTVEVHRTLDGGKDELVGTISLDGGKLVCKPDTPGLRAHLWPLAVYVDGKPRKIDPVKEPRAWLENAHLEFRSPYLWMSKARG
jgi:hypothetical protein